MCSKVVSKYFQTYSHIDLQTPTTVEWEREKINKSTLKTKCDNH